MRLSPPLQVIVVGKMHCESVALLFVGTKSRPILMAVCSRHATRTCSRVIGYRQGIGSISASTELYDILMARDTPAAASEFGWKVDDISEHGSG